MKKEINGSVRIGKEVYRAGQEDQLASVLPADAVKRLSDKGIISGFAKPAKAEEAPKEPVKEPAKTETKTK